MVILALQNPTYQPAMRIIAGITNGFPATITTTFDHNYISGTIVRLYIPRGFGMQQADELSGTIIVTGNTTFTIDINTTNFDTFSYPASFPFDRQYPQVVPTGEVNSQLTAATMNVL